MYINNTLRESFLIPPNPLLENNLSQEIFDQIWYLGIVLLFGKSDRIVGMY